MNEFPDWFEMPVGWIDRLVTWLLVQWGPFFDAVSGILKSYVVSVERILLFLPWFIIIAFFGILSWRIFRSSWKGLLVVGMFLFIGSLGYWELTMKTLALMVTAVIISLVFGIPIGIALAKNNRCNLLIQPILDAMQTMPIFVYLIPVLILFGFGRVPALMATVIYSIPPIIRLTNVGIREVEIGAVEAGEALGFNSWQLLWSIQLPLARPAIIVGINQTTMMALSMVVIGSMIGARGLGTEILIAINRVDIGRGFKAGISVVLLAIILDRIITAIAKRLQKTHHDNH